MAHAEVGGSGQESLGGGPEEEGVARAAGTESCSAGPRRAHAVWLSVFGGEPEAILGGSAHSPALAWVRNKPSPATAPCQQGGK